MGYVWMLGCVVVAMMVAEAMGMARWPSKG